MNGDHDLHPESLVLHVDHVRVQLAELGEEHVARKDLKNIILREKIFWFYHLDFIIIIKDHN
jgi:hypothetical protein